MLDLCRAHLFCATTESFSLFVVQLLQSQSGFVKWMLVGFSVIVVRIHILSLPLKYRKVVEIFTELIVHVRLFACTCVLDVCLPFSVNVSGCLLPSEQIPALLCWCAFILKTKWRAENTNNFNIKTACRAAQGALHLSFTSALSFSFFAPRETKLFYLKPRKSVSRALLLFSDSRCSQRVGWLKRV